jgi:hypothetical protein
MPAIDRRTASVNRKSFLFSEDLNESGGDVYGHVQNFFEGHDRPTASFGSVLGGVVVEDDSVSVPRLPNFEPRSNEIHNFFIDIAHNLFISAHMRVFSI